VLRNIQLKLFGNGVYIFNSGMDQLSPHPNTLAFTSTQN